MSLAASASLSYASSSQDAAEVPKAAAIQALVANAQSRLQILRVILLLGYSIMALLCAVLIYYLRYNRNVALKGDTNAARKILLPAFEPLFWILGVSTSAFAVFTGVSLGLDGNTSSMITEMYYSGRQFVFLIVLVFMHQKSVSMPALRRTVLVTLVMATYTIPLEWVLLIYADGNGDTTAIRFWVLMLARSLLLGFYTYIFICPPGRASKHSLRAYIVFTYCYYALTIAYNAMYYLGYTTAGTYTTYITVFWAAMCPLFIWRVLLADTEHWRGMGQRACALQSLFRQKHTINERISSQGLHVLIEMHRKYIIDFAHLEIKQRIGVGSSATVFNGLLHSNTPVAIKVYTPTDFTEETVAEFSHEAALCGALNHPNIVKFYGMCVFPPTICLVSELCQGSLDDVTCANSRRQHPANRQQDLINIGYMIDAARAVAYFHSFTPAFLHRDIKPANFLVDAENNVKLTDFGESRSLARSHSTNENSISMESGANIRQVNGIGHYSTNAEMTAASMNHVGPNKMTVKGTVDYMAPEIINGKAGLASYGEAADVYSLAVTMWDILNPGVEKFPTLRNNHLQVFEFVIEGNRPKMNAEGIHCSLREVIESAWQTDPRLRPTAQNIVHILENIQEEIYATFAIEFIDNIKENMVSSKMGDVTVASFPGDVAVAHMETMQYVQSEAEAIRLGNAMMDAGMLHHFKHSNPFERSSAHKYFFDEDCIRLCQPICVVNDNPRFVGNFVLGADSGMTKSRSFRRVSTQLSEASGDTGSDTGYTGYSRSDRPFLEASGGVCSCRKLGQRLENPKVAHRRFRRRMKVVSEENVLTAKLLAPPDASINMSVGGFDEFDCVGEEGHQLV